MANEIQISYATGQTLRAALYDSDTTSATVGYVWDGTEYVAVGSLVGTSWRITLTEIGSTGEYRGDLPAELVGTPVRVKVMSGATPGIGDAEVAGGVIGAESGGGGLTEEEVEDIVDERIGALVGVALSADGHLTKVTVEADQDASFSFPFTSETELTGSTLNFNVFAPGSDINLFQRATGGNGITISGTTITVTGTSTHTATAGEYWFRLRNMSNDGKVIGKGVMLIHAGN